MSVEAPRDTGAALISHWDWVEKKGLLPKNTARSLKSAAKQILSVEQDWERLRVSDLDVDGLIARFRNLSDLSPGSLAVYESRFRTAVDSYLAYLENPTTYRPGSRTKAQNDKSSEPGTRRRKSVAAGDSARAPAGSSGSSRAPAASRVDSVGMVMFPFPLRPGVLAELRLPLDLTKKEGERIAKFVETIGLDSDGMGE
jgi:hypothetical protein